VINPIDKYCLQKLNTQHSGVNRNDSKQKTDNSQGTAGFPNIA